MAPADEWSPAAGIQCATRAPRVRTRNTTRPGAHASAATTNSSHGQMSASSDVSTPSANAHVHPDTTCPPASRQRSIDTKLPNASPMANVDAAARAPAAIRRASGVRRILCASKGASIRVLCSPSRRQSVSRSEATAIDDTQGVRRRVHRSRAPHWAVQDLSHAIHHMHGLRACAAPHFVHHGAGSLERRGLADPPRSSRSTSAASRSRFCSLADATKSARRA
jgi:hypothetical protein